MTDNKNFKKEVEEIKKKIKLLFLIYDHIRMNNKNIDQFKTSSIIYSKQMKERDLVDAFDEYKSKVYNQPSNINNKTFNFINLMKSIFSKDFIPKVTEFQLILAYNLVYIFHSETGKEDIEKYMHSSRIKLLSYLDNPSNYYSILKYIELIKEKKECEPDRDFLNICNIIKNLNPAELNASITNFLLLKDSIPQYGKIDFPKLELNDNKEIYKAKIQNIAVLFEIINSSLLMHESNIRYELFKKYLNQKDKLDFVNQVLSALNKKKLYSLNENDLIQNIELHQENNNFLQNENNKGIQTIKELKTEIKNYQLKTNILSGNIQTLNETIRTLSNDLKKSNAKLEDEKKNKIKLLTQLEFNKKDYEKLNDGLQNVKYRDICSYIIDYYICILNNTEYNYVLNSNYKTAVDFIIKEINTQKYLNYKNILLKEGIDIAELLNVLLDHKLEYISVNYDSKKKEEEFIRLIKNLKSEEIGEKFKLLFDKTPLLKKFCFMKRNNITREEIQKTILSM